MRTPGEDRELAAGFLATEGLVRAAGDITEIVQPAHCFRPGQTIHGTPNGNDETFPADVNSRHDQENETNLVDVRLQKPGALDLNRLTRHVFSSSSCGICSKASIEAIRVVSPRVDARCEVKPEVLQSLPELLAAAQETFKRTGGLHACALFDLTGQLLVVREDIGRHNALDKLVGWALLGGRLPLSRHILLLSGRASFEMVQKSLAAGISIIAAISAPSSLAVELARDHGQTLVGFLRGKGMNVYAGSSRVRQLANSGSIRTTKLSRNDSVEPRMNTDEH
jgi:FdhD protein